MLIQMQVYTCALNKRINITKIPIVAIVLVVHEYKVYKLYKN